MAGSPAKLKQAAALMVLAGAIFIVAGLLPLALRLLRGGGGESDAALNPAFIAVGAAFIALGASNRAAAKKAEAALSNNSEPK